MVSASTAKVKKGVLEAHSAHVLVLGSGNGLRITLACHVRVRGLHHEKQPVKDECRQRADQNGAQQQHVAPRRRYFRPPFSISSKRASKISSRCTFLRGWPLAKITPSSLPPATP